jgi:aconitate hydratase
LGLNGFETFHIHGLAGDELRPKQRVVVTAAGDDATVRTFEVLSRIDTPVEVDYFRNGGILKTVLRNLIRSR